MAESLESFKRYIGKSETATDVVTASAMLKFAAIGVMRVPQNPDSIPIAAMMVGSPPNRCTTSGRPIPAVMTGKAANAFPIIIVNIAIPIAYVVTAAKGLPSGSHRPANSLTAVPTPAIANSAPSAASICGRTAAQPMVEEASRFLDRREQWRT